jgi:hypothetical protein
MSPQTSTPHATSPKPAQLRYLKNLAEQTGTTFTTPRTRRQASVEIDRLKDLKARRGVNREIRRDPEPREQPYATEQQAEETVGYGSTARRRQQTLEELARAQPAARQALRSNGEEPFELGRYKTEAGEKRGLYGIRIGGQAQIIDAAAEGRGRTYTVQQDVREGYEEVKGIVAAYIEQAAELGGIPMAASTRR